MAQKIIQGITWIIYKGIWLVCLGLSITASILHFRVISNNPYYVNIIPVIIITVESLAQLILGQGKVDWRAKRYGPAIVKIMLYGAYLLIFGVMSSMIFFVTQVTVQEERINRALEDRIAIQNQIKSNNDLIATLNKSLETEAETGFGRRSEAIMARIDNLKKDNEELKTKLDNTIAPEESVTGFSALSRVTGISSNWLVITSFGALVLFVYTGLIVLNPLAPPEELKPKQGPVAVTKSDSVTKRPVTLRRNNPPVTDETDGDDLNCPVCGGPLSPGQKYCCNACKQKAYRERKRQREEEKLHRIRQEGVKVF